MAKSFADDGAVGAGVASSTAPAPGAMPSASSTSGASSSAAGAPTAMNYSPMSQPGGGGGASFVPQSIPSANTAPQGGGAAPSSQPSSGGSFPSFQTAPQGGGQGSNVPTSTGGIFFDEGGAVPDDNATGGQQNPMDVILQRSMGSVDQVFQQMYKQYGLGGNDQQGGVQDEAANMPTVPGGQSESGVKPLQPAPGKLPPTSNPFGKRMAANMPTQPASQSESGVKPMQPMPGPLPPTSNPFGKRADAGGIDTDDDQESA